MTEHDQLAEQLLQKRKDFKGFLDGLEKAPAITPEDRTEMEKREAELKELHDKVIGFEQLAEYKRRNDAGISTWDDPRDPVGHGTPGSRGGETGPDFRSIGEVFVESEAYKAWRAGRPKQYASADKDSVGFGVERYLQQEAERKGITRAIERAVAGAGRGREQKATFDTAGSTFTEYDRQPGIVLVGTMRLMVADLFSKGTTTMNTIRYPREDTYTNAATTVAEGAAKPEASWDTSEQDAAVRKIAVTSKVTDEMFADFPVIRDYINARMPFMVAQTEEVQLLTGDGNAPNLQGVLTVGGLPTQPRGADSNEDATYKAITKIRYTGFFEPDAAVYNPTNWQTIRLHKTTTNEYIWGDPSVRGPETIWGLPVVVTTAMTLNAGLVGAFKMGGQIFYRQGITIESTNSNEDDFKKNLIAIRAEQRETLCIYRVPAFCELTSLN